MIAISVILTIALFILLILSKDYDAAYINSLDRKEEPLKIFYPLCAFLRKYNIIFKANRSAKKERVYEELYLRNSLEMMKLHYYKKTSICILMCISIIFLSLIIHLINQDGYNPLQSSQIIRPEVGEGDKAVKIGLKTENGYEWNINLNVREKKLEEEEVISLLEKTKDYIDKNMLGTNLSVDEVSSNLNLISKVPGTSIKVKWNIGDYKYVSSDGRVYNDGVAEEGVLVKLEAELSYYEYTSLYQKYVKIVPTRYSDKELLYQKVLAEINDRNNKTQEDEILQLPESMNEYKLNWIVHKQNKLFDVIVLGVFVCTVAVISIDSNVKKLSKLRQVQLLIDYPEIVSKFTLLLNAGMTIRGAFERINLDYQRKKENEQKESQRKKYILRYAYEELQIAIRELELGKAETMVYESYGQRCTLLCYLRFSTIIVQNMRKGTKGIVQMLELEAMEAFSERKECAKRLGEEAGTKLLAPMMGMLGIVLIIIIVPAFMNFGI